MVVYNCGDIDGGFVWDLVLIELKKNGKVLVIFKDVVEKGVLIFLVWIVMGFFVKE